MSRAQRRARVEREDPALPVLQQCRLLAVSRASVYPRPAAGRPRRVIPPTTGIAAIPAAPGPRARPARGVPLGSFAELSRQKIVFDLQLADLPVQNIDLRLVGGALRHAAALENAGGAIQQEIWFG